MEQKEKVTFSGNTAFELQEHLDGLSESQLKMLKMNGTGVVRRPDGSIRSHFTIKPDDPLEDSDDGSRTNS